MATRWDSGKEMVGGERLQGLVPREEEISSDPQTHTSPPQSCPPQKRWREGERSRSLRMHTILHPNLGCLRQCVLTPTVENKNPEPDPPPHLQPPHPPLRLPQCGPRLPPTPPITASLWEPRRIPARDCCSPLSSASPGSCSPVLALQPPAALRRVPFPSSTQPLGSGPRGGRAPRGQVGPQQSPQVQRGSPSLHIGDALAVRTVGGGRLPVAPRPGTAPRTGRGWSRGRGLLDPRPGADVRGSCPGKPGRESCLGGCVGHSGRACLDGARERVCEAA